MKKERAWHESAAYAVGKTAYAVKTQLKEAKACFKQGFRDEEGRISKAKTRRSRGIMAHHDAKMSPVLREVQGIMDVSGLSEAIRQMNEISEKHSKHPAISRLITKIEQLPQAEQETLTKMFIERLSSSSYFSGAVRAFPINAKFSEEDCGKISGELIECMVRTLEDKGLVSEEGELLRQLTGEITRPLNDLLQLYLNPKTMAHKVKRLWRMQRIFVKAIGLIGKVNALAPDIQDVRGKAVIVDTVKIDTADSPAESHRL